MTFLAFITATGLYFTLGPGGPLHGDGWFVALRRRVDAIEPEFWLGFVLLVVVPCAVFMLIYGVLEAVFGAAAMLLLGTAALFFGFGRADFASLKERFLARCNVGDLEGGALVLEEAGADIEAEDADEFGQAAVAAFVYEGFQRWFPPAFYFLLLGPVAAVAYRLIQLSADDRKVPVGSLRHLVDWLPSRLLLITFGIVGDFDAIRRLFTERALDPSIETDTLLQQGATSAFPGAGGGPGEQVSSALELLQRSLILWVVIASVIVIVGG